MYSIVLMMALGSGTDVPTFHGPDRPKIPGQQLNRCFHRCGGCWGWGGCWGCGGWGCARYWGGCAGCYGGWGWWGCACYGGGMSYVVPAGAGVAYYTATPYYQPVQSVIVPVYSTPAVPASPSYRAPASNSDNGTVLVSRSANSEKTAAPKANGPAPARIVVSLPADAKLTFGNRVTTSTSATRTFLSPALQPGVNYYYTLKAEVIRDGRPIIETQRVSVRAGEETKVTFTMEPTSFASR